MADNTNLKKALEILRLLYTETDEEHSLDTYRLIDALEEAGCKRPDRKTIDPHIQFYINEMGFGISKEKGSPNRYSWVDREFELAELKMLVDAVQSSRFISDKKSKEIINKLKKLTSRYQADKLNREIVTSNSFKRNHSAALYSIDVINEAIKRNRQIEFLMVDYDINMKEVLRHDGKVHAVSPYALIWNNDYYYMIGRPAGGDEVRQYRIDRMKDTHVLDDKAEARPANFNLDKYSGRVFDMFTGETATVELDCDVHLMNYLIDRFGKDFKVSKAGVATDTPASKASLTESDVPAATTSPTESDVPAATASTTTAGERFIASVTVDLSPTFYAWVFQFGGGIKITGPEKACNEFRDLIEKQQ